MKTTNVRVAQLEATIKEREDKGLKTGSQKRKLGIVNLVLEMQSLLPADAKLSAASSEVLERLLAEYTPGTHIEVKEGDNLAELLEANKDVKDLYKKILKSCEKQGLKLDGLKIVKA